MFSPSDITQEQSEIINYHLDTDLYIEAPAGHGKTTTAMLMAGKIAETLATQPRQKILVLTFSKMAVRQIDYEKQKHMPKNLHSQVVVKTYHAFYFDLIQQYARYLNFGNSDFGLLTQEERKSLYLLFNISNPGLDYLQFSYAQYLEANISPPEPVTDPNQPELINAAASFLQTYHKTEHRIGFEDYAYYGYRILADSDFVCNLLAYKFPIIFLDEFQNTNDLQWAILSQFVSNVRLIVFADQSQTIHGFRGAGRVIDQFKQEREPQAVSLTTNFRNSSSLYAFAKGIADEKFDIPKPRNVSFRRLEILNRDKWNLKFDLLGYLRQPMINSIAVLTKTNRDVTALSELLGTETKKTPIISHEIVTDDFSTQDRENFVLSLLQLISTGNIRCLVSVASTLTACSTGDSNYLYYFNNAIQNGQLIPDAISSNNSVPGIQNARRVLTTINPLLESETSPNPEDTWRKTKIVLQGMEKIRSLPSFVDAFNSIRDEWALLSTRHGIPTIEEFTRHIMAKRRRLNFLEQRSYLKGVFLMTLHQSQGKQFDAVFIWRCNEGIIPHPEEIRNGDTKPSQYLLYVGITRARHQVRIYYEQNDYYQPSRLIKPFLSV